MTDQNGDREPSNGGSADESTTLHPETAAQVDPRVTPEIEQRLRELLAAAPEEQIPEQVAAGIHAQFAALATETGQRTADGSLPPEQPGTGKPSRLRMILGGSVAAAAAVGVVIGGQALMTSTSSTIPSVASGGPDYTVSTAKYTRASLAHQATGALPRWRAAAQASYEDSSPPAPPASPSATNSVVSASPSLSARVDASTTATAAIDLPEQTRSGLLNCAQQAVATSPLHIELAMYSDSDSSDEQPVAVVAIGTGEHTVDVYVVGQPCNGADHGIRTVAHVTD